MPVGSRELSWNGDQLFHGRRKLIRIVEDEKYPGVMWRVEKPDGTLTDMMNRTRAKDAAITRAPAGARFYAIGNAPGTQTTRTPETTQIAYRRRPQTVR
jgi:hypothetical protein